MSKYNSKKDSTVGEAWQYRIRKEKELEENKNPYWTKLNLNLKDAVIKPVTLKEAKEIIEKYEWLGCMAAINTCAFGIFFDNVCGGVVVFGPEYADNLGVWKKWGFQDKLILLNRGVCLHWTPKNTGSKLIMEAIKMLPKKYEVITCTVDHNAGEIGTIYQACNFYYVGTMGRKERLRFGVVIDKKMYGARSIRKLVGSQKKEDILKKFPAAEFVKQKMKHRYFYFNCDRRKKQQYIQNIKNILLPYKKRGV